LNKDLVLPMKIKRKTNQLKINQRKKFNKRRKRKRNQLKQKLNLLIRSQSMTIMSKPSQKKTLIS